METNLIPTNELSPETIKKMRMIAELAALKRLRQLWRQDGCVECPRAQTFPSSQVMNRLKNRIAHYCCELEGREMTEDEIATIPEGLRLDELAKAKIRMFGDYK